MDNISMIKVLLLVLILALAFFVFILFRYKKIKALESQDSIFIGSRSKQLNWYAIYNFFANFFMTKGYINRIRLQYEILIPGDAKASRESAVKLAVTIWSIDGLLILAALCMKPSAYVYMCLFLLIYVISDQIIRRILESKDTQILKSFSVFIGDVRHQYFQHGMIDESIYDSLDKTDKIMQPHAQKMYDILTSTDMDGEVSKYNDTVPNQYLKTFMALCATIITYGDKKVGKQSLFIVSLKNLKQEIELELLKRENISRKFTGFVPITIAPFFTLKAIENWAVSNVPELESYYRGTFGIIFTFSIFVITIVCYKLINQLREYRWATIKEHVWLKKFGATKLTHLLVDGYCDRNYGRMQLIQDLLKRVGEKLTSREFFIKRLLYGLTAFCVVLALAATARSSTKHTVLYNVGSMSSSTTGATEKDAFTMMLLTRIYVNKYKGVDFVKEYNQNLPESFQSVSAMGEEVEEYWMQRLKEEFANKSVTISDSLVMDVAEQYVKLRSTSKLGLETLLEVGITDLNKEYGNPTIDAILTGLHTILADASNPEALKQEMLQAKLAEEIIKRVVLYRKQYFHWYELVLAIIFAIVAYWEPHWMIRYRERILQMSMQDEVIQFQSVIMILMHIDRMTVDTILEWLVQFSNIFEESLQECMNAIPMGEEQALDELIEKETFEPFRRLVENLKVCDKIGILNAFNEIESQRYTYQETLKQENEFYVRKKALYGMILSYVPITLVIGLYLITIFCWEAIRQFMVYSQEMKNIQVMS